MLEKVLVYINHGKVVEIQLQSPAKVHWTTDRKGCCQRPSFRSMISRDPTQAPPSALFMSMAPQCFAIKAS